MSKAPKNLGHKKYFSSNHKLFKFTCILCAITLMFTNFFSSTVLASSSTENNSKNDSSVSMKASIGKIENKKNVDQSICVKEITDDVKATNIPNPPKMPSTEKGQAKNLTATAVQQQYPMSYLKTLSNEELVNLLVTIKWSDIPDLFQYNQDAYEFYSNQNRITVLIDAINARGTQYTASDTKGIPTLIEVVRAGFYLAQYNTQISYLNDRSFHDKCLPAISTIEKNPNFMLGTAAQDELITGVGLLMWNGSTNADVINGTIPVFKQYLSNINTYIKEYVKGNAIYNLGGGISYDIDQKFYEGTAPSNTIWYGKINDFIAQVENVALLGQVTSDNGWLINNGLYWIGAIGKVHSTENEGNRVLTQAMSLYPYLGEQYFEAVKDISLYYNGIDYSGKALNMNQIKQDGINKYLPKKYTFDDGKIVVYAGNNVTDDKINRLYWASNEVRAQFYRAVGSDSPLEPNNVDNILTCHIYNSPAEYKMNRYLYGLDTNNGGIYIEGDGSFYTYERTPEESIYTLEELFRHEFTHYLQGRYLVPGMWGSSELYNNDRMPWFEEGGAEWFAGSTRTDGIVPRKSMVSGVGRTASDRYTVSKTMHSGYNSGWTFYTYGFTLYDYMYEKDMSILNNLFDAVKTNNVTAYDSLINNYSNDTTLNTAYQNQMQYLVDNVNNYYVPLVSDDYVLTHPNKSSASIYSDISSVAGLTNVTTSQSQSQFFKTFTLKGTYTGSETQGRVSDWKAMNTSANSFLKTLSTYSWSGYKTLVCYFTNFRVNSSNKAEFDVVFHGVLTDDTTPVNTPPVAKANGPYSGTKGTVINFNNSGSNDTDGTIVSYSWDFGDGGTSPLANPTHAYSTSGNFIATLTVIDDKGAKSTDTAQVTVKDVPAPSSGIDAETEPNNTFDTANGPIDAKRTVAAAFDANDNYDVFYFDVASSGTVNINVTTSLGLGASWMLYKASDLTNYVAYPTSVTGSNLIGSYNASPGRYYLYVYKYSGTGSYSINIDVPGIDSETEPNNTFDTANGPIDAKRTVAAAFDANDNYDVFYFDVASSGTVNINVTAGLGLGASWKLYKASDLSNYVAYPTSVTGSNLTGSYNASPGRYYLYVYKYSGTGSYTINVDGPL